MNPSVALIDYGSGNLRSAEKALARAARECGSGHDILVTSDADMVARAERIVLPGVGAFGDCMEGLSALDGMLEALNETVLKRRVPFLGICVGMQLLATTGHEFGEHAGLGWIAGDVARLERDESAFKIPHMGWNELTIRAAHPLLHGLGEHPHAYFVHSYEFRARDSTQVLAVTDYGGEIAALIGRDNIVGTQFHPEKSQAVGLNLLAQFLQWRP